MMQARSTAYLAAVAVLALSTPAFAAQDQSPDAEASSREAEDAAVAARAAAAEAISRQAVPPVLAVPPVPEMILEPVEPAPAQPDGLIHADTPGHPDGLPMRRTMDHDMVDRGPMPLRPIPMRSMPMGPMQAGPMPAGHMAGGQMHHGGMMQAATPQFGYSAEQRAAWLEECVGNQLPPERRSGGLIGGLLGAVVGGIGGNRLADGSRLAGTLIGGGIGAVAGAVIGTAIDRDGDDDREGRAYDFCVDYLTRYEAGAMQPQAAGYGYGYGYPAGYAMAVPVMMVAMPTGNRRAIEREEVIEEWVEESAPRYVSRPAPAPAKRIPVRPAPTKLTPTK